MTRPLDDTHDHTSIVVNEVKVSTALPLEAPSSAPRGGETER